jgi:hypothetical protein
MVEMAYRGLIWCPLCKAAVEPDGRVDATGVYAICPFCWKTVGE